MGVLVGEYIGKGNGGEQQHHKAHRQKYLQNVPISVVVGIDKGGVQCVQTGLPVCGLCIGEVVIVPSGVHGLIHGGVKCGFIGAPSGCGSRLQSCPCADQIENLAVRAGIDLVFLCQRIGGSVHGHMAVCLYGFLQQCLVDGTSVQCLAVALVGDVHIVIGVNEHFVYVVVAHQREQKRKQDAKETYNERDPQNLLLKQFFQLIAGENGKMIHSAPSSNCAR